MLNSPELTKINRITKRANRQECCAILLKHRLSGIYFIWTRVYSPSVKPAATVCLVYQRARDGIVIPLTVFVYTTTTRRSSSDFLCFTLASFTLSSCLLFQAYREGVIEVFVNKLLLIQQTCDLGRRTINVQTKINKKYAIILIPLLAMSKGILGTVRKQKKFSGLQLLIESN